MTAAYNSGQWWRVKTWTTTLRLPLLSRLCIVTDGLGIGAADHRLLRHIQTLLQSEFGCTHCLRHTSTLAPQQERHCMLNALVIALTPSWQVKEDYTSMWRKGLCVDQQDIVNAMRDFLVLHSLLKLGKKTMLDHRCAVYQSNWKQ